MAGRTFRAVFCTVLAWWAFPRAFGQELLQPGPFGRPFLVMDEAGKWSSPISVYSDRDVEMFIPDVTAPAWVQWHATEYRQNGTYLISVFSFYKNDHVCRQQKIPAGHANDPDWLEACAELRYQRRLLKIDDRRKTVTSLETVFMEADARYHPLNQVVMNVTIPLSKAVPRPAFVRMDKIIVTAIAGYAGPTADEIMQHNHRVQSDMLQKSETPSGSKPVGAQRQTR